MVYKMPSNNSSKDTEAVALSFLRHTWSLFSPVLFISSVGKKERYITYERKKKKLMKHNKKLYSWNSREKISREI